MGPGDGVIALVGVGCRLPGGVVDARGALRSFAEGRDVVGPGPARWVVPDRTPSGKPISAHGAFLDHLDRFDAELFGVSAREATALDPQQRLLLEQSWAALEHAGVAPDTLDGARVSVTIGMGLTDWERRTLASGVPARLDPWAGTGVFDSVAAGRVAHAFGLRGPAMAVHTACSSSLVALHLAVRQLRAGDVDLALVGGVNLLLSADPTVVFAEMGALSPTGRCRAFDARADGYVRSEACVVLVLERLEDAIRHGRRVWATVLGTAVNQDGRTHTLTAPSPRAQAEVVREALQDARLPPSAVGFLEAHGTGTPLGDPVEIEALAAVFGAGSSPLYVGSAKTVCGHAEAAAGVVGVLRAVTALGGRVPPHLHLEALNPRLAVGGTRLVIGGSGERWDVGHAGVSSFGLSGTNAHVVLGPPPERRSARVRGPVLVALSGGTSDAVAERARAVASAVADGEPLAEVARAASEGRAALRFRSVRVVEDAEALDGAWPVVRVRPPGPVVWAFAGQGSLVPGAGRALHEAFPAFRNAVEEVDALVLAAGGGSVLPLLLDPSADVEATDRAQPALLALGWGLAALLRSFGLVPDAVLGHSVGEVVAAVVASSLDLADAVRLVVARGRALGALPPGGAMAALRCSEHALRSVLSASDVLDVAAVNGPDDVVVSGDREAIDRVLASLPRVEPTWLRVSHAFHSPRVDAAVGPIREVAATLSLRPPALPVYSTVTGGLADAVLADPEHWARHVRATVRFGDALRAVAADGLGDLIELGAHRVLAPMGLRCVPGSRWWTAIRPGQEVRSVAELLGDLFLAGHRPRLGPSYRGAARGEPMPYPFANTRYWLDLPTSGLAVRPALVVEREEVSPAPGVAAWTRPGSLPEGLAELAAADRILAAEGVEAQSVAGWLATARSSGSRARLVELAPGADPALAAEVDEDEVAVDAAGRLWAPRLVPAQDVLRAPTLEPGRPVLVTGGSGHLGRALVAALGEAGAGTVVLASRSGRAPRAEGGPSVEGRAVDVTDAAALRALVDERRWGMVIHAAGSAAGPSAWATKVAPLRLLAERLPADVPLVAVGSVAGWWGSPGLELYGAANRAMEGIVATRRSGGGRGVVAVLGPVAGGGLVSAAELAAFARAGVGPLPVEEAARGVVAASVSTRTLVFARLDLPRLIAVTEARGRRSVWDRARSELDASGGGSAGSQEKREGTVDAPRAAVPIADLRALVTGEVRAVLGRVDAPDPSAGLFDLGLDSVLAVELADRLERALGRPVARTTVFDHPTIEAVVAALAGATARPPAVGRTPRDDDDPVAVVGFACRLPGAPDAEAFRALLRDQRDAIGPASDGRGLPDGPEAGFLADVTGFDAAAFGMSELEALHLDPQQRLLLELTEEALLHAELAPDRLSDERGAVWVGIGRSEYWDRDRDPSVDGYAYAGTGNDPSFAAGRIAHHLGFRGPAMSVNTACSSSLVALHLATRALRDGEADLAVVGGVNVLAAPEASDWLAHVGALSPTSRCRPFSARADGYVRGEGGVVLVLQRASRARRAGRRVWAVVAGSAVGHDGRSGGLTVPSGAAQEAVQRAALADAGLLPEAVDVLEAHGTGTPLGDPIELGAVARVHVGRSRPLQVCALKSRIGHLEAAAGLAGVLAQVLAMQEGLVPALLHCDTPNPALGSGAWELATSVRPWPSGDQGRPRVAAVSAFGLSGTVAHAVLLAGDGPPTTSSDPGPVTWALSSHDERALVADRDALVASGLPAPSVASALARGRAAKAWRVAAVGGWSALAEAVPRRARPGLRVGLVCAGQGTEPRGLASACREPLFEAAFEAVVGGRPELRTALLTGQVSMDPALVQSATVAVSLVLARWWKELGIEPVAVAGHSLGELAAASVAGVLGVDDALWLAEERGAACGRLATGGGMVAVRATPDEVLASMVGLADVDLAVVNAADRAVLSGSETAVQAVLDRLGRAGTRLPTTHAFHSPLVEPAMPAVAAAGGRVPHAAPVIPLLSGRDGLPVSPTADHWARHLRAPVRFDRVVAALAERCDVVVELGWRPGLVTLLADSRPEGLAADLGGPEGLWRVAGELWSRGAPVELERIVPRVAGPPLPAPTRLRRRLWLPLPGAAAGSPPTWEVRWEPAGVGGIGRPRRVAVLEPTTSWAVVEAVRGAASGTALAVRTRGAFDGVDPLPAAVDAVLASARSERPDLELLLLDGVPDEAVDAAVRLGAPRVRWVDGRALVPTLVPAGPAPELVVAPRSVWLVTGGGGAVGRRVAEWLVGRGARVVTVGRSGAQHIVGEHRRCDVRDRLAMGRLLDEVAPAGVVHAAGVEHAGLLARETESGWSEPWGPKVEGARVLAELLPPEVPLVVVGSAVAWLGRTGQAAYGAANAGAEAVVRARRAAGGRGWVLRFGPWAIGMARDRDWSAEGVRPLTVEQGLAAFARAADGMPLDLDRDAFEARRTPAAAGRSWSEPELLREVLRLAATALPHPPSEDQGWVEAGADSVAAVELARRIGSLVGRPVPVTLLYDHGTPRSVARALAAPNRDAQVDAAVSASSRGGAPGDRSAVAIVGMAVRFPGASTPEELWNLLVERRVAVRRVPPERWDADAWFAPPPAPPGRSHVTEGGFLEGLDRFDPDAFGLSAREAERLDPQQRLLLELSFEALERAGHRTSALRGSRTGTWFGIADRGWVHRFRQPGRPLYPDAWAGTGAEPAFAPGRVAHALGLRGPAVALDTTCSSALVAVHLAARSLRAGECDRALAGGVALQLLPEDTAYLCSLGALSPTHRCHVFDARADGYVRSEGCGVFVLRRLADAERDGDPVLGVLLGSAVDHDGASAGLTVPNGEAQRQVLRDALADAGVTPRSIGCVETHGTGTRLGDPIEVAALRDVYGEQPSLLLGAVKANLGHAELAAGAASLAKALLMLERGIVPPHPVDIVPNPEIDLGGWRVPGEPTPLAPGAHVAVSAFGLSGTNAHLVVAAPPIAAPVPTRVGGRPVTLLAVSGSTEAAVRSRVDQLLRVEAPLEDVAAAAHRVLPGSWRAAVAVAERGPVSVEPRRPAGVATVGFLYSGQGTQYAGMGLELDAHSVVFRSALSACADVLDPLLGRPLRSILSDPDLLGRTECTQPALFAVMWARTVLLRAVGIEPAVVAGHSLGELVAATVAGVWSLDDALRLVAARGRLMERHALPGAMVAVGASREDVSPTLTEGCVIAAVNAADEVVVAGSEPAVEATLARWSSAFRVSRLPVGRPFHSPCVDPMLEAWEAEVTRVPARAPVLPWVSLLDGGRVEHAPEPRRWRRHARDAVRCDLAMPALDAAAVDLWLDLGPHPALAGLVHRGLRRGRFVATERRDVGAWRTLAEAVGAAFEEGAPVDLRAWEEGRVGQRVRLPPTPFDRRRCWPEEPARRAPTFRVVQVRPVAAAAPAGPVHEPRGASLADRLLSLAPAVGGVVVVRGAGPDARALAAGARCLRFERGDAPAAVWELRDGAGSAGSDEPHVVVADGVSTVPRLRRYAPDAVEPSFSGTWWVTGGTGAVGMQVADWLCERGARRLVSFSRRPPAVDDPRVARWRSRGVEVVWVSEDVADADRIRPWLERHPPDGVVHAAGSTRPGDLGELDRASVEEVLRGKVEGARTLDALLGTRPLQAFVLISSVAGVWGSRRLAPYAAANAWLDALAEERRGRGLVATSVSFGPWGGGGMVDGERAAELGRAGLSPLVPSEALRALGDLVAAGVPHAVVVDADLDRLSAALSSAGPQPLFAELVAAPAGRRAPASPTGRPEDAEAAIVVEARRVLRFGAERPFPRDVPLAELGFDSLMATELKTALAAAGVDLPLGRLLAGPSVAELVVMAGARGEAAPASGERPEAGDEPDRLLWWTHLAAVVVGIALASGVWALLG